MKFFDLEMSGLAFQQVNFKISHGTQGNCYIVSSYSGGNPKYAVVNNDPNNPCYKSCAFENSSYEPPAQK